MCRSVCVGEGERPEEAFKVIIFYKKERIFLLFLSVTECERERVCVCACVCASVCDGTRVCVLVLE